MQQVLVVPLGEPAEWLQRLQVQLLPRVAASQPRLHFGRRLRVHVCNARIYACRRRFCYTHCLLSLYSLLNTTY